MEQKKSMKKTMTVCLCLCSAVLVGWLLLEMARWVGVPGVKKSSEAGNLSVGKKYEMFITNQVSDALDGVLAVEKVYWIGEDEMIAPKPNQDCYGETDDPAEMAEVLEKAKKLLDGQSLYFSTDVTLQPGSKILYYLDDTIFAVTWKQVVDYGIYTYSEIKIAHPSQFRRFLANGEYGSDKLYITTEMAASVNAVVASSGDFYRFRNAGILVNDGKVNRLTNGYLDTCYIDDQGDMHFTKVYDYMTQEEAQKFVDDNHIQFSLAFGPILIRDGKQCTPDKYKVGEVDEEYSRAALCQMDKLHYLLVTANVDHPYQHVPTIYRFAYNLLSTGCKDAYALDGGQTAVIAMNNELINSVMYGYQRKISDIIYFATAIPNG